MLPDFTVFFQEYEALAAEMDRVFASLQEQYPGEVACELGCSDCCYALFDLSLVEAVYISRIFREQAPQKDREAILERADQTDRTVHQIKYRVHKSRQKGEDTEKILQEVGKKRVRCPLLTDENRCYLYAARPVNCRLYGLPLSIGGEVHACSFSGFKPGGQYPTVYMDRIQDRLLDISHRMAASIPTKYTKLGDIMVPLSMALLTEYDENYLGIVESAPEECSSGGAMQWTAGGGEGSR